ncbi:uncharacterized protein MELLADRAFT_116072 [Melampsora larici-populina 98AG31]|uniref:J domain-containing protein n=1 Tax=Melampsora larici-populina (strain 98AG31 / pathotype 3-4-7) TaxID=747676 RepID=F4RGZ5_MELLP|nr:uncharacterized protein MELLADRAFT_116072 [Melampsora larici-populina 98AG31]EGG08324.1 hypothetical protein MELLADRAFT_116072 [Melampsora larici-populina 98AG31]
MANPYRILNVSPNATRQEIRAAYIEQACQSHPSKQQPNQHPAIQQSRFRQVAEAYTLVGNDSNRQISDIAFSLTNEISISTPTRNRNRSASEATGRDGIFNSRQICDVLPPGLKSTLIELDPIKVFNRALKEMEDERKRHSVQKLTPLSMDHQKSPFRNSSSPDHHQSHSYQSLSPSGLHRTPSYLKLASRDNHQSTSHYQQSPHEHHPSQSFHKTSSQTNHQSPPYTKELHQALSCQKLSSAEHSHHTPQSLSSNPTSRERPTSILSVASSSAGRMSSRSSNTSSRRRVSFTEETIKTDELKKLRECLKNESTSNASFSNPSLYDSDLDNGHERNLSSSLPIDCSFLSDRMYQRRKEEKSEPVEKEDFPWSNLDFDDPRMIERNPNHHRQKTPKEASPTSSDLKKRLIANGSNTLNNHIHKALSSTEDEMQSYLNSLDLDRAEDQERILERFYEGGMSRRDNLRDLTDDELLEILDKLKELHTNR